MQIGAIVKTIFSVDEKIATLVVVFNGTAKAEECKQENLMPNRFENFHESFFETFDTLEFDL